MSLLELKDMKRFVKSIVLMQAVKIRGVELSDQIEVYNFRENVKTLEPIPVSKAIKA